MSKENSRRMLFDVMELALDHVHKIKNYLTDRRLDDTSSRRFQLGYIPDTQSILDGLIRKEWDAAEAMKTATELKILLESTQKEHCYFSPLSERVIFPIFDVYGRIIALSGRTTGDLKPKYFNTVFTKGQHLYGLNFAHESILKENYAIVVEGYMDTISTHKIGAMNTVAIMGTAFTDQHAVLLSRYTNNIFLLLDEDKAGKYSTAKYIREKAPDPLMMKVIPKSLPKGYGDIDEFVRISPDKAKKYLLEEITQPEERNGG